MIEYQEVTHEKVWEYLKNIASYLTLEEIETLTNLFYLMGKDYTPIQSFGDSKLEFILKREINPYINTTMPCYFTLDCENDTINKMLISFDESKSHMDSNELYFIASILPMMDNNQMTIHLVEESGQFMLKLDGRK